MCILSSQRKFKKQSVESSLERNLQLSWKLHWMADDPRSKCLVLAIVKHHGASIDTSSKSLKGHRIQIFLNKPFLFENILHLPQSYVICLAFTLFFSIFLWDSLPPSHSLCRFKFGCLFTTFKQIYSSEYMWIFVNCIFFFSVFQYFL